MNPRIRPAWFSLLSTALVLVLVLVWAIGFLVSRAGWASETLASIEPRYARLLGLREQRAQLESTVSRISAEASEQYYAAALGAERVGTEVQQKLRAAADQAGLTIVGSQILPAQPLEAFEEIAISLTLEGNLQQLADFDDKVVAMSPLARLKTASIQPLRGRGIGPERFIRVQLTISVLREVQ